ncbi:MAG: LysR family transcriptional regulator [Pseudobutyrivibrio sp.]|uniref:LysR family transcriptional regulator n=1 Tax=Pseudobutyrivibrio xylanivorans TaxID=185007 RepID=A0A6M0LG17_PSEXY|nr:MULTISPECIES: LysR family transcriptional regulator [Pseudobutyrivibrio]MBE5904244.1 LysR family transcriptional regulator [Pseudobutyrivibrio sp.]NEX01525.1 LysR family transcriptional regulator [Pseudobutyrivibrio xylanivorans]SCY34051.1 DNA-binding transcriptional regulator, LysR family [Pseudobutyrivibrio sp. AR14]SFR68132.1 DNA-binding transcriptional regulator, LysR family [Pseudobutyrivibrio sp. NOR37]
MTLQQVLYALTIQECGSMNKAAEKLYIVQPTLTSAIQELENEVGITIFMRTNKGVIVTPEGEEFLNDIRGFYRQYDIVMQKYSGEGNYKRKFGVSTQHYTFAVRAFVDMAKQYDMNDFDFALRETTTMDIINDVSSLKSEVGILYINERNKRAMNKLFVEHGLEFHTLIKCRAFVYLWKDHPLASQDSISIEDLQEYPCMFFEQRDQNEFLAEEILSENFYPKTLRVTDRSTMLNLIRALNGYTLCSGIIWGDLNGDGYIVVPYRGDEENPNSVMEIGYVTKKNSVMSKMGEQFIEEIHKALEQIDKSVIYEG